MNLNREGVCEAPILVRTPAQGEYGSDERLAIPIPITVPCVTWTRRHAYEAVYDEVPSGFKMNALLDLPYEACSNLTPAQARAFLVLRKYVHSVCRHCGDVIDREDKP